MIQTVSILLMTLLSMGLVCEFETEPEISFDMSLPFLPDTWQFFESKIWWHCVSNMTDYSCISAVHNGTDISNPIIQTNPDPIAVLSLGVIDQFLSDGRVVNVYYQAEGNVLKTGQSYLFGLHCSDGNMIEEFSAIITPEYRGFDILTVFFGTFLSTGFLSGLFAIGILFALVMGVILWMFKGTIKTILGK